MFDRIQNAFARPMAPRPKPPAAKPEPPRMPVDGNRARPPRLSDELVLRGSFSKADTNGDGAIGRGEFLTAFSDGTKARDMEMSKRFTKWDSDKDGKLSFDEYKNGRL